MPLACALLGGFAISARVGCYGNITRTRNVSEYMLVLALCLVSLRGGNRRSSGAGCAVRWVVSGWRRIRRVCYGADPISSAVVDVLWPNGWTDQDETWHAGRPRPWPHCIRWGASPL